MERIFTPMERPGTWDRLKMKLSDEDAARIPGRGHWGPETVTDLNTGVVVEVEGAPCGAGCHCAAVVVRVVSGDLDECERFDP